MRGSSFKSSINRLLVNGRTGNIESVRCLLGPALLFHNPVEDSSVIGGCSHNPVRSPNKDVLDSSCRVGLAYRIDGVSAKL